MKKYCVINTWKKDSIVYKGTKEDCEKYIKGNNIYQMSYSKLKLKENG